MSVPLVVIPVVLTVAALVLARLMPRSFSPAAAVWALGGLVVLATLSTLGALVVVAAEGLSALPTISDWGRFDHVEHPGGHGVHPVVGLVAAAVVLVAGVRLVRYNGRLVAARRSFAGFDGVEVVVADGPVAFAVPGRRGGVVVGHRVMEALDRDERRAVLAHELAHLRFHHHRHVRTAGVCAAVLPYLAPVAAAVRFGTERWADEAASEELGSRRTVARAIARVALIGAPPAPAPGLAFADRGVLDRIEALGSPPGTLGPTVVAPGVVVALVLALIGGVKQVHQLQILAQHLWS